MSIGQNDAEQRPEWSHEDCVLYEVAREAITALISYRSQWIADALKNPRQDVVQIATWRDERARFAAELRGLNVRDAKRLTDICDQYGLEIRRLDALHNPAP